VRETFGWTRASLLQTKKFKVFALSLHLSLESCKTRALVHLPIAHESIFTRPFYALSPRMLREWRVRYHKLHCRTTKRAEHTPKRQDFRPRIQPTAQPFQSFTFPPFLAVKAVNPVSGIRRYGCTRERCFI
jgi:hypothetical protein